MADPTETPPESTPKVIHCGVCESVIFPDGTAKKVSPRFKELTEAETSNFEMVRSLESQVKSLKEELEEAKKPKNVPSDRPVHTGMTFGLTREEIRKGGR
jgi:hypothetical protein